MILNKLFRRAITLVVMLALFSGGLSVASAQRSNPFCADLHCAPTRQALKEICDLIVKDKNDYPTIYVGGYYMRDLVAGYEIFGDRRYLDTAIAYGDYLLGKQMPNGFWATGYGTVYLADTGSALGLFIVLYKHVDHARQTKYFDAIQRYVNSLQTDGMIRPNGAFGTGWRRVTNDTMSGPIYDQYTLSSVLTGAEIFTWMYHKTKQDKYREISYRALRWVFSTMRSDGNIPYILAEEGADWTKRGDPKTDYNLWTKMTYGTSAYVGEGVISFDLYCGNPAWKSWIEKAVRPNIEFLLRTQLSDGTWSTLDQKSWDRTRSPGIVDYLIWYYERVDRDPRIATAVQRFDAFMVAPQKGKSYGLLNDGADFGAKDRIEAFNTATSLTGRALADILSPGVDAKW
ncbi:MAG: prenyltransferase/squalene oxidase repeat-containing protein [Acidobacteriaceae bacterium]